jgi:hypothetical protein
MDDATMANHFSTSIDKLLPAMQRFREECEDLVKDKDVDIVTSTGKRGASYSYADIIQVTAKFRPAFKTCGLIDVWTPGHEGGAHVTVWIFHIESGQWMRGSLPVRGDSAQAFGSFLSYATRRLLMTLAGKVADGDDDDGAKGSGATAQRANQPRQGTHPGEQTYAAPVADPRQTRRQPPPEVQAHLDAIRSAGNPTSLAEAIGKAHAALKLDLAAMHEIDQQFASSAAASFATVGPDGFVSLRDTCERYRPKSRRFQVVIKDALDAARQRLEPATQ